VLLQLYALYKQGTEGDVTSTRPGGFDFKAIAKYDAWKQLAGLSKDAARQQYVELVTELAG
jgi:diazepam-binding inhibitor (GABA receptor modulating acyl-CoA-binding protein)